MCSVSYTRDGQTKTALLHYAQGILDHAKYHRQCAEAARRALAQHPRDKYWAKYLAVHEEAAKGFSPHLPVGGCEEVAWAGGYWQVNTPEAEAAFCAHADKGAQEGRYHRAPLHLDFDAKTMTIAKDQRLCNWGDYAPDGWQVVIA